LGPPVFGGFPKRVRCRAPCPSILLTAHPGQALQAEFKRISIRSDGESQQEGKCVGFIGNGGAIAVSALEGCGGLRWGPVAPIYCQQGDVQQNDAGNEHCKSERDEPQYFP
jgi:hypothetical protein